MGSVATAPWMRDALIELCSSDVLNAMDKTECEIMANTVDCTALGGSANPDFWRVAFLLMGYRFLGTDQVRRHVPHPNGAETVLQ